MRKQTLFMKSVGLCFAIALFLSASVPSHAAGKDLAVLVVGKTSDTAMATTERSLIEDLTRLRVNKGWSHKVLPIFSYHFDKATERSYCEERLHVKSTELVTVGIVELEGGVPTGYVYRENAVGNAAAASDKVMSRAQTELASRGLLPTAAKTPTVVVSPPPTASKTPIAVHTPAAKPVAKTTKKPAAKPVAITAKPAATTAKPVALAGPGGPWSIQVGLFSTLKKARMMAGKVKEDGKVEIRKVKKDTYRVLVGNFPNQTEAYSKAKQLQGAGYEAFSVRVEPTLGKRVP